MERISGERNSGKKSVGILAAVVAGLLTKNAHAERFALTRTEPRVNLAEIFRADGPGVVEIQIDATGKSARIAATPGSPVYVEVGCPPEWRLDVGRIPPRAAEQQEVVHYTLPGTGIYNASLFAPVRVGETQTASLACVKGDDREDLSVAVTAVAGDFVSGEPFPYRAEGLLEGDATDGGMPVAVAGSALVVDQDVGGVFSAHVDPVARGANGRVPVGATYRLARNHERARALDGTEREVNGWTHCGFVGPGWNPILAQRVADVRLELEAELGVCRAQEIATGPGTSIPGITDAAGRIGLGVQVGGKNLAGRVGADAVLSDQELLQGIGVSAGVVGRF